MQPIISFGSGDLFLTPYGPAAALNPTPMKVGTLQDVSIEVSSTNKELHGQYKFPVAVRPGQGKIQCKAKFAMLNGKMINDMFFGATLGTAPEIVVVDEVLQGSGGVAHSGFARDLGVTDAATGMMQTLGTDYTVSGGNYSFNVSGPKKVSYTYAGTGVNFVLPNQRMGSAPLFQAVFSELDTPSGAQFAIALLACISSKLTIATKLDDFTIPEFDFSAFADTAGNLFSWWSNG